MAVDVPVAASQLIADRAYLDLRERIVTLRLPPGSPLREEELMVELSIGRTPLREAIKRLALENLVAVQPRRGTHVTPVDTAGIVHVTEVRAELEGYAAELAARRMDSETHARVRAMLAELDRLAEADPQALMDLDERVHRLTWEASHNPLLVETLERYFALSLRVWHLVLDRVPGLGHTVHEQTELLRALADRDAVRSRTLMRDHVLDFQREIISAFNRA